MKFTGVLIGSADPQRLTEYYGRFLGEAGFTDNGYTGWMFGSAWITVGPHSEVTGSNPQPGRLIWNLESEDVRADAARFVAAGAIVVAEPYTMGDDGISWIATFADPDGNYFQLMSPMQM